MQILRKTKNQKTSKSLGKFLEIFRFLISNRLFYDFKPESMEPIISKILAPFYGIFKILRYF